MHAMLIKKIMKGVEDVAKMIKANRLFVVRAAAKEFESEIFDYVWDEKKGVPVKENDHAMDTTRYAIHNHIRDDNEVEILEGIF
jgi:hypothetical protein